jgi:hypothetical protein
VKAKNPQQAVSQPTPTPEPKAQYTYGLTESQLRVLRNVTDAVDGLKAAMSYEEEGGGDTNPERQVFAGMADSIWAALAGLSTHIERQKLGGAS